MSFIGEQIVPGIVVDPIVKAWRIQFKIGIAPGENVLRKFNAPEEYFAVAEEVPIDALMAADDKDGFVLAFMPSGQIDGYQRINQLQEWVASDGVPVELMLQSDRVLWTPRRAFVLGAADRGDDLVNSLVTFTFFESRLSRLEEEVFALLGKVSHDSHLTHQVGRRDLRRWSDVNDITRRLWSFRACFAAIEPRLEKAPLSLSGQARRLYSELFVIGELADRCEALDGQLEVLEDLYESANDRLSEFSYFSKEYLLEAIIIGVLAVDLALTIIDLFVIGH